MNSWKVPYDIAAYVTSDAEAFMAYYGTREKPDIFTKKGKKKCQEILNVSLQKLISWCNTRSSNHQPVNMIPTYNKKDAGADTTLLKVTKPLT